MVDFREASDIIRHVMLEWNQQLLVDLLMKMVLSKVEPDDGGQADQI